MPTQEQIDQTFGKTEDFETVLQAGKKEGEATGNNNLSPDALTQAMQAVKDGGKAEEPEAQVEAAAEDPEPPGPVETPQEEITEESAIAAVEETEKKSHRDRGAEKRIARLTMERERLKGQLEAMRAQQGGAESNRVYNMDPSAPNPANYPEGEHDVDFKVDLKLYQRDVKERQDKIKSKIMEAKVKHPDLDELIADDLDRNTSGIRTSNTTVERLLVESDNFVDLWHHLLANPEDAIRIAALDPVSTAREIGKIEARLSIPKASAAKKVTLPAPPNPVRTTKPTPKVKPELFGFSEY